MLRHFSQVDLNLGQRGGDQSSTVILVGFGIISDHYGWFFPKNSSINLWEDVLIDWLNAILLIVCLF